jgi:hypothetical protein
MADKILPEMSLLTCLNVQNNVFSIINKKTNINTFENDCCMILNHLKALFPERQYTCEFINDSSSNVTDKNTKNTKSIKGPVFNIFEEISSVKPGWIYNTNTMKKIKIYELTLTPINNDFSKLYTVEKIDNTTNTVEENIDEQQEVPLEIKIDDTIKWSETLYKDCNFKYNESKNNKHTDTQTDTDNVSDNIDILTPQCSPNLTPHDSPIVRSIISYDDFTEEEYHKYAYIDNDENLNEYINEYLKKTLPCVNVYTQTDLKSSPIFDYNSYINSSNSSVNISINKKLSCPYPSVLNLYDCSPAKSSVCKPPLIKQTNPPSFLINQINNKITDQINQIKPTTVTSVNSINDMFINELKSKLKQENFGLHKNYI